MAQVDFLICGSRGFDVLQQFVSTFGSASVRCVASYADKKVANDPFQSLAKYCAAQNIVLLSREAFQPAENTIQFVIGWQWMFTPQANTIVLHDSLLPRYRGFAPLVNSLINGEPVIGVTAFFASERYDEGDIILQESIGVTYPVKIAEAIEMIKPLYFSLVSKIYQSLLNGESISATAQDHSKASYSLWRDEQDYRINWHDAAEKILRLIDAVGFPYAGATTIWNDTLVTITGAELYPDVTIENRTAGKVIFIVDGRPVIVCGSGLLKLTDASVTGTGESILPFKQLRSRFH